MSRVHDGQADRRPARREGFVERANRSGTAAERGTATDSTSGRTRAARSEFADELRTVLGEPAIERLARTVRTERDGGDEADATTQQ